MKSRRSVKAGFSFGLTSGVITTLGLVVGLESGTGSKIVVIGGVLTIAIADAFSDALGMHIAQEAQDGSSGKEIWLATVSTFLAKFGFALSFIVPILIFDLRRAVYVNIGWGMAVLAVFSLMIAKQGRKDPMRVVAEHLAIAAVVIAATYLAGEWIAGLGAGR